MNATYYLRVKGFHVFSFLLFALWFFVLPAANAATPEEADASVPSKTAIDLGEHTTGDPFILHVAKDGDVTKYSGRVMSFDSVLWCGGWPLQPASPNDFSTDFLPLSTEDEAPADHRPIFGGEYIKPRGKGPIPHWELRPVVKIRKPLQIFVGKKLNVTWTNVARPYRQPGFTVTKAGAAFPRGIDVSDKHNVFDTTAKNFTITEAGRHTQSGLNVVGSRVIEQFFDAQGPIFGGSAETKQTRQRIREFSASHEIGHFWHSHSNAPNNLMSPKITNVLFFLRAANRIQPFFTGSQVNIIRESL